jgi:predicted AAA+ superfamily ATPase
MLTDPSQAPGQGACQYKARIVDDELDELMASLPALVIEGAKGVGKTLTASRRASTVHGLDDPQQRGIARGDPARLLGTEGTTLIDEWQYVPESWDLVRRAVDAGAAPGRFLLTGSMTPAKPGTHSGAGRIVSVRMRPLSLAERDGFTPSVSLRELLTGSRPAMAGHADHRLEDYAKEILASGFPGLRGLQGRALRTQLDGYLRRIVERDFPELGHSVRNPVALRRWMRAYAAASSTSASFEKIRDAASAGHSEKPAKSTTIPHRDALERLWILDPVEAWLPSRNRIARLSSPPKHQLADPALAARLLGVDLEGLLNATTADPSVPREGTLLGALFESLLTLSVRVYAQAAEARVSHLRTAAGTHEVDLIVERANGGVVAIEVKLTRDVDEHDTRHLKWLAERIGDELLDAIVITTGQDAYRRRDGIAVIPAGLLGP